MPANTSSMLTSMAMLAKPPNTGPQTTSINRMTRAVPTRGRRRAGLDGVGAEIGAYRAPSMMLSVAGRALERSSSACSWVCCVVKVPVMMPLPPQIALCTTGGAG